MSKPIPIPRGYRILAVGEVVQPGDKVYFRSRWEKCEAHEIGHAISPYSFRRIRKLGQRTAAERDWRRAVARAFPEGSPVAPKTGGAS